MTSTSEEPPVKRNLREARVSLDAIAGNAGLLPASAGGPFLVDVRGNAYGHGASGIAGTLERAGAAGLLVSTSREAAALRETGVALPVHTLRGIGDVTGASASLRDPDWPIVGPELFGLDTPEHPDPSASGLVAALRLSATVLTTKRAAANAGVSYGYIYRTTRETTLAMVSLGYSDGIDRHAGEGSRVWFDGTLHPVAGRVAMDVFMIDVGDAQISVGDEVVVFGDPREGVPSVGQWAATLGKTGPQIVAALGDRVIRSYR